MNKRRLWGSVQLPLDGRYWVKAVQGAALLRPPELADSVEFGDGLFGQLQRRRGKVLVQVRHRRGAGDQQDVGRALQEPGKRHLHRRRAQPFRNMGKR